MAEWQARDGAQTAGAARPAAQQRFDRALEALAGHRGADGRTTYCDLTQSWSAKGGGIRTYLTEKRRHIAERTGDRHVLIVPGPEDRVTVQDRLTRIEIASPKVPGSPNYRLLLRSKAVSRALAAAGPELIECLDAYNLPWAALGHRACCPGTALVAGYRTDFPTVYVEKLAAPRLGAKAARKLKTLSYRYAADLYRRFDAFYTLNGEAARQFAALGVGGAHILPLGVDLDCFHPDRRAPELREGLGVAPDAPLLIYAGRIDREKKAPLVVEAFKRLPRAWGAHLVMLGEGNERAALAAACDGWNAHFPGFIGDRQELARYLASSDIYVSGMEDETFGISIIEAQAAGLPVVGVRAGAMTDRVRPHLGRLGAPGDAAEMAANISAVWMDRLSPMRQRARAHVEENFSWRATFATLFGTIYPDARARRAGICGPHGVDSGRRCA